MPTLERTDIHRPSAIIPADYTFVAIETQRIDSFGDCQAVLENRRIIQEHMKRTGGFYSQHEHGGNCGICGAHCIYTVLFYHAKSNTYVRTGNNCAQKLDMAFDENTFKHFVAGVKGALEAQAGKKKALALLENAGIGRAWEIPAANRAIREAAQKSFDDNLQLKPVSIPYEETKIEDVVSSVIRYGNLTEKQASFIQSLLNKIDNRAAVAAERAAEAEAALPCPSGRVIITGRVLSLKTVERQTYYYGDSGTDTKILVQALDGWKVWGNRCNNMQKGDLVTFTATIQVSDKDPKFGFFSRATKASFVNSATGEIIPEYPFYEDAKINTTPELLAAAQAKWRETYGEVH